MKRLIKGELYDSYKDVHDHYYECFKNPTSNEWQEIIKSDQNRSTRCLIMRDGTVYAWPAEVSHSVAIQKFNLPNDGEHINGNSLEIEHLCAQYYTTPKTLQQAFKNSNSLYNYFSNNTRVKIDTYCHDTEEYKEYEQFNIIGDIINLKEK